ncbi:MAG: hypothetical protein GY839_02070 [candidate division Zixibacteria bacterium]|nr:hypothetical protein [candidate division Zixibacteria bacterium]
MEFPQEVLLDSDIKQPTSFIINTNDICLNLFARSIINNDEPLSSNTFRLSTPSEKDPTVAFVTAFVPGFFIHGLGHYYVGDNSTGTLLLGAEALSISLFAAYVISEVASSENQDPEKDHTLVLGSAYVLFFSSWIYDFIGAPVKAKKMNQKYAYFIYPDFRNERISINLTLSWK